MNRSLIALMLAAAAAVPALAQQADYCDRSGYVTGVARPDDVQKPCDPRQVPRVSGVPQDASSGNVERYREGRHYYGARGPEWRRGRHVPREYRDRQYWVDDWREHRLPPPPRGHHWVQVGGDYALVQDSNGVILQLILMP